MKSRTVTFVGGKKHGSTYDLPYGVNEVRVSSLDASETTREPRSTTTEMYRPELYQRVEGPAGRTFLVYRPGR